MAALPSLTEAVVRAIFGASLYDRAEADLAAGKFSELTAFRNGVLTAMWDDGRRSAAPALHFDEAELGFDCDCDYFAERAQCVHCAGLALAWALTPREFERVNEDFDLDFLLDLPPSGVDDLIILDPDETEDEFYEDELDAGRLPPGLALPAPPPAGPPPVGAPPPGPPSPLTLTTLWPDLKAAFAEELDVLTVAQLRSLAQRRGVKLSGTKREPIVQALAEALGTVPALRQAWEALSPTARLLAGIVPFVETDYGANYVHVRQALQNFGGKLLGQFDQALEELQQWGVVFRNRAAHLSGAGPLLYFLPPDEGFVPPLAPADEPGLRSQLAPPPLAFGQLALRVLLALKVEGARYIMRPVLPPHPVAAQVPELRGWPMLDDELDAAARSKSLFQALGQRPLSVPPAPSLLMEDDHQRLAAAVGVPPDQADFVLRLLVKLGLVHREPGHPAAVREEGFQQLLRLPPLQYMPPLVNAFMGLNDWTELNLALAATPGLALKRQVRYGVTYAALLGSLATARFNLLQLLRRAPPGRWVEVDQLVTRARHLNVLRGFWPLPTGIYLEKDGRSLEADKPENWRAGYRPFAEALLAGPLHWQGFVDLAYRGGQLAAVRTTELGALALHQRDTFTYAPAAAGGPAVTFTEDGSLLAAPGAASPELLSTLSLLGEVRADAAGQLRYAVTPAGALRAFQAGWEPDRLLETLSAAATQPVPRALAEALRGWWAHFGDVQLYTDVALLELADDYALPELLASTSLAQHLLYRFSPRVIALRPEGVAALRDELVSRGYTPKLVDAD